MIKRRLTFNVEATADQIGSYISLTVYGPDNPTAKPGLPYCVYEAPNGIDRMYDGIFRGDYSTYEEAYVVFQERIRMAVEGPKVFDQYDAAHYTDIRRVAKLPMRLS